MSSGFPTCELLAGHRPPLPEQWLQTWLDAELLDAFARRILVVDVPVVRCAARLHVPDPRPERDALIAATAVVHGLTVVTRNTKDFDSLGLTVVNPWR